MTTYLSHHQGTWWTCFLSTVDGTVNLHLVGISALRKWSGARNRRRLLLITALSLGEKLIKVENDNNDNHNKDYLCHHSYASNRNGVFEGAAGGRKITTLQLSSYRKLYVQGLFLFSFFFPSCVFQRSGVLVVVVGGERLGRGRFRGLGPEWKASVLL